MASDPVAPDTPSASATHGARAVVRRALRTGLALLLGGIAVFGAMALVRQGLVPLVDALFHPGPAVLSIVRRSGIFIATLTGYAAWVQLFEHRSVGELHLRPLRLLAGGASGALMIGLPIAALFAFGAYQVVLYRGLSSALWASPRSSSSPRCWKN